MRIDEAIPVGVSYIPIIYNIHTSTMAALRSRFRGALVGALVGDCMGAYWEMGSWKGIHPIEDVRQRMEEQISQTKSKKAPLISYTDDTALTFAVADSLIECGKFDAENMAERMTKEFFDDPRRGYGPSIGTVFSKMRNKEFTDLYDPAKEQFKGQGSCGNGSAMRISPVGLFGYKNDDILVKVCTESSKLTHYHISGVNNALLQAMAIQLALHTEQGKLNPEEFVDRLLEKIKPYEEGKFDEEDSDSQMDTSSPTSATEVKILKTSGQPSCTSRLMQLRAFLTQDKPPTAYEVQKLLGHGVLAAEAVPCAIFAFLHKASGPFSELVAYAISLGGDTDTIGSMAGAIGGAYLGLESIPQDWINCCEASDRAISLADALHDLVN